MSEPVTRAEFDSGLAQLDRSVDTKLASLDKSVDAKLASLDKSIDAKLASLDKRVDAKLAQLLTSLDARLDTKLERLETRLISQFWDWARPREKRERSYRARLSAAEAQLAALQERMRLIEDREAPAPPNSAV